MGIYAFIREVGFHIGFLANTGVSFRLYGGHLVTSRNCMETRFLYLATRSVVTSGLTYANNVVAQYALSALFRATWVLWK